MTELLPEESESNEAAPNNCGFQRTDAGHRVLDRPWTGAPVLV